VRTRYLPALSCLSAAAPVVIASRFMRGDTALLTSASRQTIQLLGSRS
jgi:hypothetical protein